MLKNEHLAVSMMSIVWCVVPNDQLHWNGKMLALEFSEMFFFGPAPHTSQHKINTKNSTDALQR